MVRNKLALIAIFLMLFGSFAEAQVNRYMVFFTDKNDSPYSLTNPEEYLSETAIARREKQSIIIDETDLPVNPEYVSGLAELDIQVYHTSKWFNGVLIQEDQSRIFDVQSLSYVSKVEYVAPDKKLQELSKSGRIRPFLSRLKTAKETSAQNEMLSIDEMHGLNYKGQGMVVAVFDGGFESVDEAEAFSHIFEEERMLATYDFVTNSGSVYQFDDHGTRVFSAIGAFDASNFIGTAYEASFILCVTEDVSSEYRIEEYNWLFAAEFADSIGVDVINTSLGFNLFDDESMDYDFDDLDGKTAVITRASNMAGEKGMLLVASVGNEGNNSWGTITPPADSQYVLAVGSVNQDAEVSSFSSTGPSTDERIKPDVVALGSSVSLIGSSGNVVTSSGTSFASPLVAGLATGIWQANPTLTNQEVIDAIRMSGSKAQSPDNSFGYGIPDFLSAAGNPVLSVDDIIEKKIKVYPNPFRGDKFFIDLNSKYVGDGLEIQLYDLLGNLIAKKSFSSTANQGIIEFRTDANLVPGTYLLRVYSKKLITEVKLLKF